MTRLQEGDKAPNFKLPATSGTIQLKDFKGEWLVLYFYPKDDTPGCTKEACDFRDLQANAAGSQDHMDAKVVGVSADDLDSHEKFQEKYELGFPLLVDEGNELAKTYAAYGEKKLYGKVIVGLIRSTFIINPKGEIAKAMYNVKATGHGERVAKILKELQDQ